MRIRIYGMTIPFAIFLVAFGISTPSTMTQDNAVSFEISHHHIGISVPNAEESAAWYQRMLGFEVVTRMNQGSGMTVVHIRRGNCYIELFQVDGAKPLPNPVGTAPGVLMKSDKKTIISLPGVPSEMKAIFEGSVLPILKKTTGNLTFFETSINVTGVVESEMAPVIDRVMHDNPYVYIKSHPKGAERIHRIEFHLSTTADSSNVARNRVSKALAQLCEIIEKKGGKIKTTHKGN